MDRLIKALENLGEAAVFRAKAFYDFLRTTRIEVPPWLGKAGRNVLEGLRARMAEHRRRSQAAAGERAKQLAEAKARQATEPSVKVPAQASAPRPVRARTKSRFSTNLEMVTSHWCQPVSGLSITSAQFYDEVVSAVEQMRIPGVKFSSVYWKESSFIGQEREYLRVERNRFVYDICAAPFGAGSFFSSWLCIVPFNLSFCHLIGNAVGLLPLAFLGPLYIPFAIYFAACLWLQGVGWFTYSRQVMATTDYGEDFLLGLTGIGPFLCAVANRRPTYYQIDAAAIFQSAVQAKVVRIVDALCEQQNVRTLSELERKPVAREFLKK